MAIRKRKLKPDPQGRYRPYLGYRIDGMQQRFNLGMDKPEAERRMNRLYELWQENVLANGEEVWSPLALHFAKEIAAGKRRIEYPFQTHFLEADDPAAEYAQMVHVERERFPSLDIVPADPACYAAGLERNEQLVSSEVQRLQERLGELGALAPKSKLPEKLINGKLHEALDAYADDDVKSHNVWPGSNRLKQSGHRRLEMIERFASHLTENERRAIVEGVDRQRSATTGDTWQVFKYTCRPDFWRTPADFDAVVRVAESVPEEMIPDQEEQYGPQFLETLGKSEE